MSALVDLTPEYLDNLDRSIHALYRYAKQNKPLYIFTGSDKWKFSKPYKIELQMANYFANQILLNLMRQTPC